MQSPAVAQVAPPSHECAPPTRLIRISEVQHRTGFSRSQIYRLITMGKFPRPIKAAEATSAWIENEIQAWIEGRIAANRVTQ
jgi:prophage regulatory protein